MYAEHNSASMTGRTKNLLLDRQLRCEVVPEATGIKSRTQGDDAALAMPVVLPAGVIHDGVEADTTNVCSGTDRHPYLTGDEAKPTNVGRRFRSRFADQDGTFIALVRDQEHLVEGLVLGISNRCCDMGFVNPLVIPVVIAGDDIKIAVIPTQFRSKTAAEHVPCLEL